MESDTYLLADYPILAKLARDRTQAKRLDERACRYIYSTGAFTEKDFSTREKCFYDSIHGNATKQQLTAAPNFFES